LNPDVETLETTPEDTRTVLAAKRTAWEGWKYKYGFDCFLKCLFV
jgi:hypothetical protein